MYPKLGFIGAGNMAGAMIGGLIANQWPAENIYISSPRSKKLLALQQQYKIHIDTDNDAIAKQADVLILAVKPQILVNVVQTLAPVLRQNKPLLISVAAGVSTTKIAAACEAELAIIRCMPNTPSLVQEGMSGLYANTQVTLKQHQIAEQIMLSIGKTLWVTEEDDINKIAAISGCGPAYFFYFMEALEAAGEALGLTPEIAQQLTLQTATGAVLLAQQSKISLQQLRQNVTSPNGSTASALAVFAKENLATIVAHAAEAACARSRELNT